MDRRQKVDRSWLGRFLRQHRRSWRRFRRLVVNQVLHADDPPHRLALGVAIGVFVTFTPTIGFQMVLVLFLAWLFAANKAAGLPVVWLSNPATLVPIYWPCYSLGCWILHAPTIDADWWSAITHPPTGWAERVTFYWSRFSEVFWPLWVGGIAIGLLSAYATYYAVYYSLYTYRMRRWGQLTPPRMLPSLDTEASVITPTSDSIARLDCRSGSAGLAVNQRCENPNSAA